jgi:signal peptidase I
LKLDSFDTPKIFVTKATELQLSGQALIGLMQAIFERGMPFRFRATGGSMLPFINNGDVITLTPIAKRPPRIGEVVAFIHPETGNLIVHRIVGQKGSTPLFRGDAITGQADGLIPIQNLLGRVSQIERNGRLVWLGLGAERVLIAWLSRMGLLVPLRSRVANWRNTLS